MEYDINNDRAKFINHDVFHFIAWQNFSMDF